MAENDRPKTTRQTSGKSKTSASPETSASGKRKRQRPKIYELRTKRYGTRLSFVRRVFGSDAAVADALGVDRAQVTRWGTSAAPNRENAERLTGLDAAIELLSDYLEADAIADWLTGFNAHLGGRRPVDVLRSGRIADVIGAIEAFKAGAYA